MTDVHKKIDVKNTNVINPVVAGITGAIAGGMAVAAAVVMSDKKNQKKVSDAWVGAKDKISDYVDSIKSQPIVEKAVAKVQNKE